MFFLWKPNFLHFHLWTLSWYGLPANIAPVLSHQSKAREIPLVNCARKRWILWSDIDVHSSWSSACISLEVFLGSLSTIHTILLFNLGLIFLFWPYPEMLDLIHQAAWRWSLILYLWHAGLSFFLISSVLSLVHVQGCAHSEIKHYYYYYQYFTLLSLFK